MLSNLSLREHTEGVCTCGAEEPRLEDSTCRGAAKDGSSLAIQDSLYLPDDSSLAQKRGRQVDPSKACQAMLTTSPSRF